MGRTSAWVALSALVAASGCIGEAEYQVSPAAKPAPAEAPGGPTVAPVRLSSFQGISAGLPAAGPLRSSAHLDGALYLAVDDPGSTGLFSLLTGATEWKPVATGLTGTEKVSQVVRIDTALYATVADVPAARGGLLRLEFGASGFVRLPAPPAIASAVVKKNGALLLATVGGLYASTDRGATWVRRSRAGEAPFGQPVKALVAASAAQRIFAVAADGTLFDSDDEGTTWSQGLVKGKVGGVAAGGSFVLLHSDVEGALRSDNYGNTFRPLSEAPAAHAFAVVGARAFLGTLGAVRVSDDGGANWRDASDGLPPSTDVLALFAAGPALIASGSGQVFVAAVE